MNGTDLITSSRKLLNYINALDYYYLFLFLFIYSNNYATHIISRVNVPCKSDIYIFLEDVIFATSLLLRK